MWYTYLSFLIILSMSAWRIFVLGKNIIPIVSIWRMFVYILNLSIWYMNSNINFVKCNLSTQMLMKILMNISYFRKCIYLRFANLFGNFFEHSCMLFLTLSSPLRRLGILRGRIFCTPTFTDGTKIKNKICLL